MSEQQWKYTPSADVGMTPVERFRSIRREQGLVSWSLHHAAAWCMRRYLCTAHRLVIEGAERLPIRPPFVVVANHASHMDALILSAALPSSVRGVTFPVAAGDVFFESVASSVLTSLFINALPLWRKKVTRHALDDLRTRLMVGDCGYVLFPEGARSRDGKPLPFKPGLGRLVAGTSVPVVPCWIDGAFEALPPDAKLPRLARVSVRVGESCAFHAEPNERSGWDRVAREIERRVLALGGLTPPERPSASDEA